MINKCIKLLKKYEEIIRYLIIGIITTMVNLIIKYLLLFTILDAKKAIELQIAVIISWIGAVMFAYITNRIFVFKSKNNNYLKEIISFVIARIVTLILEMFIMWLFITLLKLDNDIWVIFITIISQMLVIIVNYIFSKLFVFKGKPNQ